MVICQRDNNQAKEQKSAQGHQGVFNTEKFPHPDQV